MATSTTSTSTTSETPILKLRANPCVTEKTPLIEAVGTSIESQEYPEGDWRRTLFEEGYVVIKDAISKEKALQYQKAARDHLASFGTNLDFNDPSTWKFENLPDPSYINTFTLHCIPHEKFMWDIRTDPEIRSYFEKLWGTKELLVSFDALNITFPGRKDQKQAVFWPHVDQSPFRNGLHAVQGIISLGKSGPKDGGLMVYKNSQKLYREFFDKKVPNNEDKWKRLDSIQFTREELDWFLENGCEEVKIECDPGDLILWDSRTIHFGKSPDDDAKEIRTIAYICYTPAEFATEDELETKKKIFEEYKATSHWPHTNIIAEFEDFESAGHVAKRTEPLNKPEYSDDLLKLAGIKKYH